MLPEEMSDEEREAITCTEAGSDDTGGYCPHLALFSDWAYAGHSILGWEPEMGLLAARIIGRTPVKDEDIAELIVNSLSDEGIKAFNGFLDQALPYHDHHVVEEYVEKFDGVSSGGPTYRLIFLKKKEASKRLPTKGSSGRGKPRR